ncbi:hypothetical protein PhCBS80983_g04641 [Powellomyces hirtus]|uniref:Ribonuclease H n=1 Tax=Powellomyces hirtus TaxID=109895 RepID=A0A507DWY0_9FUNG|nr:hypothetical protein PhCBS80983_g04641 [Powellomyces hirtus]
MTMLTPDAARKSRQSFSVSFETPGAATVPMKIDSRLTARTNASPFKCKQLRNFERRFRIQMRGWRPFRKPQWLIRRAIHSSPQLKAAAGRFYAVTIGRVPGIYTSWAECQANVNSFPGALFKSFSLKEDAAAYVNHAVRTTEGSGKNVTRMTVAVDGSFVTQEEHVGQAAAKAGAKQKALSAKVALVAPAGRKKSQKKTPQSNSTEEPKLYYAVKIGRTPGVYTSWTECEANIHLFPGAVHKSFRKKSQALKYLGIDRTSEKAAPVEAKTISGSPTKNKAKKAIESIGCGTNGSATRKVTASTTTKENAEMQSSVETKAAIMQTVTAPSATKKKTEKHSLTKRDTSATVTQEVTAPTSTKKEEAQSTTETKETIKETAIVSSTMKGKKSQGSINLEIEATATQKVTVPFTKKTKKQSPIEIQATVSQTITAPSTKKKTRKQTSTDAISTITIATLEPPKKPKPTKTPTKESAIHIYTDGACSHNGVTQSARAGIGVFYGPSDPRNISVPLPGKLQTNNRAELSAVCMAIEGCLATTKLASSSVSATTTAASTAPSTASIPTSPLLLPQPIVIHTDSMYVRNGITKWIKKWKRDGWGRILNKDLWVRLDAARTAYPAPIVFKYVKAHCGVPGNEAADALAVSGASRECDSFLLIDKCPPVVESNRSTAMHIE